MILAVALNPAWDRTYFVRELRTGEEHRVSDSRVVPGGKAVNVARVIRQLGGEVVLAALLGAGDAGRFVRSLEGMGVHVEYVSVAAPVRTTLAVVETGTGRVTEFRELGGPVTSEEVARFWDKLRSLLSVAHLVVCSGSLPVGVGVDIYREIVQEASARRIPVFLDAAGDALRAAVGARPYLVKVNFREALELHRLAASSGDLVGGAREAVLGFLHEGVKVAVVTLGAMGACMGWEDKVLHARVPLPKPVVNPVGSGDAMMAAMACAFVRGAPPSDWLRLGVAAGAASALEATAGQVPEEVVSRMVEMVRIVKLGK